MQTKQIGGVFETRFNGPLETNGERPYLVQWAVLGRRKKPFWHFVCLIKDDGNKKITDLLSFKDTIDNEKIIDISVILFTYSTKGNLFISQKLTLF